MEEQVERTSVQDVQHRAALGVLIALVSICLVILVFSSLSSGNSAYGNADVMWLRHRDIDRVEQILKEDRTITDEEMREINTMQLRNFLEEQKPKAAFSGWIRQKTFIGVPLLVVLACAVYLLAACYPNAVFLWGDEVDRYNKMLQTRRVVWSIIIGVTVIGVVSKLLSTGLISGL